MNAGWWELGACVGMDPELFHPHDGENAKAEAARAVCAGCPVRNECLDDAVTANVQYGVWGGTTPRERRRLRKARGLTGVAVAHERAAG